MEHGVRKPQFFDGTNYPYWKICMSMLHLVLQVIEALQFKWSSMIRTTKLTTLCSRVSRLLSLSELEIWLRLTRSGPP
jgi:hypothetical protein